MFYDIDQVTLLKAAIKSYGPKAQIGNLVYIDTIGECITVYVTPFENRSFKARFYYKKGSFDPKDPDLTSE